jgi:hypothetical protein
VGTTPACAWSGVHFNAIFPDGVFLEYGQHCVSVKVPSTYFNSDFSEGTKGLCGRFDGIPSNDGTHANGYLGGNIFEYNNPTRQVIVDAFAETWEVPFGSQQSLFPTPNLGICSCFST